MNKRGRPFKPENLVKRYKAQIRLLDEEKQAFDEAAQLAGLDFSSWARERLKIVARKELDKAKRKKTF